MVPGVPPGSAAMAASRSASACPPGAAPGATRCPPSLVLAADPQCLDGPVRSVRTHDEPNEVALRTPSARTGTATPIGSARWAEVHPGRWSRARGAVRPEQNAGAALRLVTMPRPPTILGFALCLPLSAQHPYQDSSGCGVR